MKRIFYLVRAHHLFHCGNSTRRTCKVSGKGHWRGCWTADAMMTWLYSTQAYILSLMWFI